MTQFYVTEVRPHGERSTVGLFYTREEAAAIVRQLESLPGKHGCRYVISTTLPTPAEGER
ncbi:MAG: hypothetical protein HYY96_00450 [Candidatus Tectomicrobia bacterium]|nr:hypothetical protein [Candidatus Tectomicrobia bacterium]